LSCARSAFLRGALSALLSCLAMAALPAMAQEDVGKPAPPAIGSAPAPEPAQGPDSAGNPPLAPCPKSMGIPTGRPLAPVSPATAAIIRERVRNRIGVPSSICRTPFGLYEVVVDGDLFYVDERANYLLNGSAFDLRTQENLTESRRDDVLRVDFKTLPLELAVKTVRGDGSRQLAIFEDPNCPYCKRFEKDIATLSNTTIYTFLYPILSRDKNAPDDSYPKSMAIWCAADRASAWEQVMLKGRHLEAAPATCQHPLEELLSLGQKLHVTGTPTLIFIDGRRAPGAIPMDRVEAMMADAQRVAGAQQP
jgi:thiol:disulfide interchange protein DsbC